MSYVPNLYFLNLSITIKTLIMKQKLSQAGAFSRYFLVLLLAGIVTINSSFKKESSVDLKNHHKTSSSFKGEFIFSLAESTGAGKGTHIGNFTLVEDNNLENFPVITGTAVITAANGDQIFANHSGLVQFLGDGMAQVDAEFTITGGTGRFTEATGSFESHGSANLAIGTANFIFDGEISY